MIEKRPVNLDLGTIDFPIPALASITHRLSGLLMVAGSGILLWMLDKSLSSAEGFNSIVTVASSPLCKAALIVLLAALIFHSVAGIKHLLMDIGIGESLKGGVFAARMVFLVSVVLTVWVGDLIW